MTAAGVWSRMLLGIALFAGVCGSEARVLELNEVTQLSIIAVPLPVRGLKISGLAFHSALAVDGMRTRTENNTLVVEIDLLPATRGLSGRFDETVLLPPEVDQVVFGERKIPIWSRAAGVISPYQPQKQH